MININEVSKNYKIGKELIKAVDNVTLNVEEGEFLSIVGHSGSGKTTLLSLIGGLTKPDNGTILLDNTNIWSITDNELSDLRSAKINFIYQFSSLIPTLNVIENILLPTAFSKDRSDKYDYAFELLDLVKLKDKTNSYPSQLSGGQQRRVAIARAFINNPKIILADEPTGDLDEDTEAEIMQLFKRMNKEKNITFFIVTHSTDIAKQCKKSYKMINGLLKPN
ncbi:peptide ABC transporter ATP-binding protein [Candidatus Magnetoovum chiemensis]|nr:peptide ABC transporter ATP-binding protein [Candidatus Magnetoovum chiemensis]